MKTFAVSPVRFLMYSAPVQRAVIDSGSGTSSRRRGTADGRSVPRSSKTCLASTVDGSTIRTNRNRSGWCWRLHDQWPSTSSVATAKVRTPASRRGRQLTASRVFPVTPLGTSSSTNRSLFVAMGSAADTVSDNRTTIDGFWFGMSQRSVQFNQPSASSGGHT